MAAAISIEDVQGLVKSVSGLDYKVSRLSTFQNAFVSEAYYERIQQLKGSSQVDTATLPFIPETHYERLECLGDAMMKGMITAYLFRRFPDKREDFATEVRIQIESQNTLASWGRTLKFHRFILVNQDTPLNNAIYEDVLEAFVGALFTDSGSWDITNAFVVGLLENETPICQFAECNQNHKNKMQSWWARNSRLTDNPRYIALKLRDEGLRSASIFNVALIVPDSFVDPNPNAPIRVFNRGWQHTFVRPPQGHLIAGVGCGVRRIDAEQEAAGDAATRLFSY